MFLITTSMSEPIVSIGSNQSLGAGKLKVYMKSMGGNGGETAHCNGIV